LSLKVENAKVAAEQVQQLVTVVTPQNAPKKPKILNDFELGNKAYKQALETQLNQARKLVEEFTKNKGFKTVASTFKVPEEKTHSEARVNKVLNSIEKSIKQQLDINKKEITKISNKEKELKTVTQTILTSSKGKEKIGKFLKNKLNSLDKDSKQLETYRHGLDDQVKTLNDQLLKVKSLAFKNGK
jgi:soluble cytochrome b562